MNVIWFPTYRCNLKCPQCAARALPIFSAPEISYKKWIEIFKGQGIKKMTISGREPFMFKGIFAVMNSLPDCVFHIESNILLPLEKMLVPVKPNVTVVGTCHFPPGTRDYDTFVKNAKLLKERGFNVRIKYDMLASPGGMHEKAWEDDRAQLLKDLEGVGVWHGYSGFDDMLLFHRYFIYGGSVEKCRYGYTHVTISPDGRVFRCTGHIYQNISCMGDLKKKPLNEIVFKSSSPCEIASCTCGVQGGKIYDPKLVELADKKIDINSKPPQNYYLILKEKLAGILK